MADELGAEILDIDESLFPGSLKSECGLRFLPGCVKGEGLFLAALRKPGETADKSSRRARFCPRQTGHGEFRPKDHRKS